jgi:hypothetical protein
MDNDIKYIKYATGLLPNAADLWAILICVLAAFGKPIAWYIWMMFVFEVCLGLFSAWNFKREQNA